MTGYIGDGYDTCDPNGDCPYPLPADPGFVFSTVTNSPHAGNEESVNIVMLSVRISMFQTHYTNGTQSILQRMSLCIFYRLERLL